MSSRSASLCAGSSTRRIPARCAPSTFSFTPPIGSTFPRSVISPVIATSSRAGRPVRIDAIAVKTVTPADGPSFGCAPAGTCTWMSFFSNSEGSIPSTEARSFRYDSAADADSFITSPS